MKASSTEIIDDSDAGGSFLLTGFHWLCLLLAAVLYSVVALAPKLLVYERLNHQYETNQRRLVSLEDQVQRLGQEAEAFERDPLFAAAVARTDFRRLRPEEQRIAVDPSLTRAPRQAGPQLDVPEPAWPWYYPPLKQLIDTPRVQGILLLIAGGLLLLAFVPLGGVRVIHTSRGLVRQFSGLWGFVRERYTQH